MGLIEVVEIGEGDGEGALCHFFPEVGPLVCMIVGSGCVADDAETDEGFLEEVARLCDGCRLHVYGQCLGEEVNDALHLFTRVDKPVACDDEARMEVRGEM